MRSLRVSSANFCHTFRQVSNLGHGARQDGYVLGLVVRVLPSFPSRAVFLPFRVGREGKGRGGRRPFAFMGGVVYRCTRHRYLSRVFRGFFREGAVVVVVAFLVGLFFFFPFRDSVPTLSDFSA